MAAFLLGLALGAAAAAGLAAWLERRRRVRLGRYLAFGAHELNAPLTALTMTLSNLVGGIFGDIPPALLPWLRLSREQVARLAALTGQLRDFVHLELDGNFNQVLEEQPGEELVQKAVAAVEAGFAQSAVPLAVDCPRELPAVRADPDRTARELASLLHHARKLRSSGPVSLSARAGDGFVAYAVAFEGPPLEAGEAERSLDLYYPGRKSHALRSTGFGLGLSARLMEREGGRFELRVEGLRHTLVMRAPIARK